MKRIQIISGLTSGLRSYFDLLNSIEIDDKPFAVGGFGEVYHCIFINGATPPVNQVVKLFIDNSKGSAEHNFKTTQRLQRKVYNENQKLLTLQGKSLVEQYPAFKGLPQFSFRGILNGMKVIGFTSDNLVHLGFTDFEHILQDVVLQSRYHRFPIERKMLLAYQLVSAFKVLEEFYFIHADLKPGALFINLDSAEIAVIDYDSGVITENVMDEPLTWGAANDWVAPEIWEQQLTIQNGDKLRVDVYSDRWSVAIGVHYLLATFHPLFYLTELSPRVARQYFAPPNQWPFVNKNAPYFQRSNELIYDQYLPWVQSIIPSLVRDKLSHSINFGYRNPVARTSYSDWKFALQSIQNPPNVKVFKSDKTAIISGMELELTWEVENAHTVTISHSIGAVASNGSTKVRPEKNTCFKLDAVGYFGSVSQEIEILLFPTPVLESLWVPIPDFCSRINMSTTSIRLRKMDVPSTPERRYLQLPLSATECRFDLKSIKPMRMEKTSIFDLSRIYEAIRRRIST